MFVIGNFYLGFSISVAFLFVKAISATTKQSIKILIKYQLLGTDKIDPQQKIVDKSWK